jgi:methylamine--corrinoid protein Co-methyltransferase
MAGVKRDYANSIAEQMLKSYENKITKDSDGGPLGHTFDEIYDLNTLEPRKKFLEIYNKVKKDLENLGIEF